MTDTEKNIAIAEACGWKRRCHGGYSRNGDLLTVIKEIPNYVGDLNACHQMEAYLESQPIDVQSLYYDYVSLEMGWTSKTPAQAKWESKWNTFRATARARSVGFVRTIGKWKETTT